MELLSFNSKEQDIADALKGAWGKEVYEECSLVYCGHIVWAFGALEDIKKRAKQQVYSWKQVADGIYVGIIK